MPWWRNTYTYADGHSNTYRYSDGHGYSYTDAHAQDCANAEASSHASPAAVNAGCLTLIGLDRWARQTPPIVHR